MKKLLLFFALWSGVAGAMQPGQNQMNQVATEITKQASQLTPEERKQAVEQAAENVQKLVDSCGNDKELLKMTLSQRIKNLLGHPIVNCPITVTVVTCLEATLYIVAMQALFCGIDFVAAITLGKSYLITNWFSKNYWLFMFALYKSYWLIMYGFLTAINCVYWLMYYYERQEEEQDEEQDALYEEQLRLNKSEYEEQLRLNKSEKV